MKYKVGDKVLMGPEKWQMEKRPHSVFGASKVFEILDIDIPVSMYDSGSGWFQEAQILGYAFEYGDEIEVSDDGENWKKDSMIFTGHLPNNKKSMSTVMCRYHDGTDSTSFNHARPIQRKVIERNNTVLSDCSLVEIARELIRREECDT